LLTQWLAKYGYLPIALIGMAGLALEIGTGEWKSDDTIVPQTPVVAETFVERSAPMLETKFEPEPSLQRAAPVVAESFVETDCPNHLHVGAPLNPGCIN
jgi:hypothetical protein